MGKTKPTTELDALRAANLRQRLLRASRAVNATIVTGLQGQGFAELRSTHTALLSNLDLAGASLTTVATRAGMSKQAMGRLADELVQLNYIERRQDPSDRRAVILGFTPAGRKLMQHSFEVMNDIETRCARRIGKDHLQRLLESLTDIATELDMSTEDFQDDKI